MLKTLNQSKFNKLLVCFLAIISLTLIFPSNTNAYTESSLTFRRVNRFDDIFASYVKNDEKIRFECTALSKEIDYIDDRIDGYKEDIEESTDPERKARYQINLKTYRTLLTRYRSYEIDCTDDGIFPPEVSKHYVSKNSDYDDIRISVIDREKHPARLKYSLSEEDDSSLSATLVITDKIITYPYDFSSVEKYSLSLRPEDQTMYLEKPLIFYQNYYYYVFTNFSNSDEYLTTAPFISKKKVEFTDLDQSNSYFDSINSAIQREIIQGYADGTFRPNEAIKRKEFLKIIFEAADLKAEDNTIDLSFTDLGTETWSIPYIKTAVLKGIINPKNSQFFPNHDISIIEALKVISQSFGIVIPESSKSVKGLAIEHWGNSYANYFQENKLLDSELNEFNRSLKRAEGVDLIIKTLALLKL